MEERERSKTNSDKMSFVCVERMKIAQLKDFARREPQTKASETDEMREREMDSSAHEDVREAQDG